jgi:predicted dehydrogenase
MNTKIAVIGCGAWGINHVRTSLKLQNASLVAICDGSDEACARAQKVAPGIRAESDPEVIFADDEIDAVIIATPAPTHASVVKEALSADKHVFVEKPFVLDLKDGGPLVKLAEERKRVLMVGHLLRYHPYFQKLEQMALGGDLGQIHYAYADRVNLGVVRKDENAFWSLAPHDLSMMCAIMNEEPVEIATTGQAFLNPGIEDVVFSTIKFANGTIGHIHVSWLDPHKHRKMTIVGDQKMAVFDDMEPSEKLKIYDKGVTRKKAVSYAQFYAVRQGDISIPSIKMTEPLLSEEQHFIDCIQQEKTPITDGHEAMRVLRCLVGASMSLKAGGKPIKLSELI